MSNIKLPTISNGMSNDELANAVAILVKQVQWLMDGNIDSTNAREIGGWNVGQDSLVSTNGNVGLSSKITGGNDVRFWAGNIIPEIAPFRVYNSGKIVVSDGDFTGSINMTSGSISWSNLSGSIPDSSLASGSIWNGKTTLLTSSGVYTGSLTANQINVIQGITLGSNASIVWSQMNSDPLTISAGNTATNAQSIATAIANGTYTGGTFINNNTIFSPNIIGTNITGTSSVVGATIKTAASGTRVELNSNFADVNLYSGANHLFQIFDGVTQVNLRSPSNLNIVIGDISNSIFASGTWSFGNANVSGLTTAAISGLESRLQYLEDHCFIFARRVGNLAYFDSKNTSSVDFVDVSG